MGDSVEQNVASGAVQEQEEGRKEEITNELDLLDDSEGFSEESWAEVVEGEDDVVYGTEQITGAAITHDMSAGCCGRKTARRIIPHQALYRVRTIRALHPVIGKPVRNIRLRITIEVLTYS